MTAESSMKRWRPFIAGLVVIGVAALVLILPAGRGLVGQFFRSLRVQKVQAVNVDLSSFTDPNANPALHEMVAKMISDKVVVTKAEKDQQPSDPSAAAQLAGFPVQLLANRKDAPKLVVTGEHDINLTVDRSRLQAIFDEAGHANLIVPQSLDGAAVSVQMPRAVQAAVRDLPPADHRDERDCQQCHGPDAVLDGIQRLREIARRPQPHRECPAGPGREEPGRNRARGCGNVSHPVSGFSPDS